MSREVSWRKRNEFCISRLAKISKYSALHFCHIPLNLVLVEPIPEAEEAADDAELAARVRSIKELAVQIVNMSPNLPSEAAYAIQNIESASFLIHFIASNLQIDVEKKQELLETRPLLDRSQRVLDHLENEVRVLEISEEIRSKVKTDVDQQQREFFLRQQLKTIQDELGETEGSSRDADELRERMVE